jgi:nucleotide-binding universal stress UspA family protein
LSFQKILVPCDGSRFADKVLENTIGIARLSGPDTRILLLHVTPHISLRLSFERPVYSPKTGKSIPLTQYIQELSEKTGENASKMLEEKRRKYTRHNVKIEPILPGGYPAEKITEFANNEKVDLIVTGSVGLSRLLKVSSG